MQSARHDEAAKMMAASDQPGRLGVIVPTFNRAHLLPQSLDSLLHQTARPFDQIIVVVDGSTDDTLKILEAYRGRVIVHSQPNRGKAAAMNAGLALATTDYLTFLDDDDLVAHDGYAPLAAALDADPALDLAYGTHLKFLNDRPDQTFAPEFWGQPGPDKTLINFLSNMYPFQAGMLIRRKVFDRIGKFREDIVRAEDTEILIRLGLNCKAIYVPHIVFHQRGHAGMRRTPQGPITQEEALCRAVQFDQIALNLHLDELTLDCVMPDFAAALADDHRRRAAYLVRACLFARRAFWPQMITDLMAADRAAAGPASPAEIARAAFAVMKPQLWDILIQDAASIRALAAYRRQSAFSRAIVDALTRSLPWHIRTGFRSGHFLKAWRRFLLTIKILGIVGTASRFHEKLLPTRSVALANGHHGGMNGFQNPTNKHRQAG